MTKVVGCLLCGYRTDKEEDIARFKNLEYVCCDDRAGLLGWVSKAANK